MHETKLSGVKGYVDQNGFDNGVYYLKGWCFHETSGIFPLRICRDESIYLQHLEQMPRHDVASYFHKEDVVYCGWNYEVTASGVYEIQMYVENDWKTVFSLRVEESPLFSINKRIQKHTPRFLVVDDFYEDPDSVRTFALTLDFNEHKEYHKGKRTDHCYRFSGLKDRFEELLGRKIKNWDHYGVNGCFQVCLAGDQLVYHTDLQQYAGIIFLTPDAPPQCGTSFFRSKKTQDRVVPVSHPNFQQVFQGGFLDSTNFDLIDKVGNVYNRLVIFHGHMIHSASEYFGQSKENGRLFQIFFFDLE